MDNNSVANKKVPDKPGSVFVNSGGTTFEIIEHYRCEQTYLDIVKNAIRRECELS